ncbi:MAG: PhnD/SsuA/transferrin family substrate-binding protein, partial [Sphaerospermopsis sp. SIO1G2]|nr:PhnD/SsuA/transferrin family substrate-binding protein [Sphaerospermopsis sp. SIO1G2]
SLLKLTSCQARNTFPLIKELGPYLEKKLGIQTEYEHDAPWQDRARWLYEGRLQFGWICSKPYAIQMDETPRLLNGIAVPIMKGSIYNDEPVYYSYLMVHKESPAVSLTDLAGARVAYNEPGSQSGYFSLLWGLEQIGETADFFGEWVESGAHAFSLEMLQAQTVEAAAIDTTLWDYEISQNRDAFDDLKIIGQLGPFPGPPLAAHVSLPQSLQESLQVILMEMHDDPEGKAILEASLIERFTAVSDQFYRELQVTYQENVPLV